MPTNASPILAIANARRWWRWWWFRGAVAGRVPARVCRRVCRRVCAKLRGTHFSTQLYIHTGRWQHKNVSAQSYKPGAHISMKYRGFGGGGPVRAPSPSLSLTHSSTIRGPECRHERVNKMLENTRARSRTAFEWKRHFCHGKPFAGCSCTRIKFFERKAEVRACECASVFVSEEKRMFCVCMCVWNGSTADNVYLLRSQCVRSLIRVRPHARPHA